MTPTRKKLYQYKGNCCFHCRTSVSDVLARFSTVSQVFHFNHIDRSKKHPEYDSLIRRVISSEILAEMDKCVLLCTFCHGILHGQGASGRLTLTLELGGRIAEQTIRGQIITETIAEGPPQEIRLSFVSDEKILICPYQVAVGDQEPRILTRGDLEADGLFINLITNTRTEGPFQVRSLDGTMLFRAEKLDGHHCQVHADVRFPVMAVELNDDSGKTAFWIRNGCLVPKKEGDVRNAGLYRLEIRYPTGGRGSGADS